MEISSLFQQLGIALGLGLLVGLQRESAASPLAGVRTFPLVTVLGTVCGLLSQVFGGWILAAGIIALALVIFIGKIIEMSKGHPDQGVTTEVALLLMFAVPGTVKLAFATSMPPPPRLKSPNVCTVPPFTVAVPGNTVQLPFTLRRFWTFSAVPLPKVTGPVPKAEAFWVVIAPAEMIVPRL